MAFRPRKDVKSLSKVTMPSRHGAQATTADKRSFEVAARLPSRDLAGTGEISSAGTILVAVAERRDAGTSSGAGVMVTRVMAGWPGSQGGEGGTNDRG